jgi:phosphoglycolate phosphatase-like HAD superfamily hydrolase
VTATYQAVVYDLDETLVHLDVDWDDARRDVAAKLRARGMDVENESLWALFEQAGDQGYQTLVHDTLAEHERSGARTSTRLSLADDLPHEVPVGICSLNAESACRIALELHGLDGYVDAIVGRNTVSTYKPDPGPLLYALDILSVPPSSALFIGDSPRDEQTAERAGVQFQYAEDRL